MLAEATAFGVERVAAAIGKPGGDVAVKVRIVEGFLHQLGEVLKTSKVSVVPGELAQLRGFFEGMGKIATEPRPGPARQVPVAKVER